MISEFVLENFLQKHLELIEPGLKLLKRQFKIKHHGKIDFLCEDKNSNLVIVELKIYAHLSTIEQINWYKKAILIKFPEKKARFILTCLDKNEDIPRLCKVNNIEFLQIKDKRIPKYEDISSFPLRERQLVDRFLSDTSFYTFDCDFLALEHKMSCYEVDRIINKINNKTNLTIKKVYCGTLKRKGYALEL